MADIRPMATDPSRAPEKSENYNFDLPKPNTYYDVEHMNGNFRIVDRELALKANQSDLDELAADIAAGGDTVTSEQLQKKADKTYVDNQLKTKVNNSEFTEFKEQVGDPSKLGGVEDHQVEYAVTVRGASAPSSGWSLSVPTVASNQILWMRWRVKNASGEQKATPAQNMTDVAYKALGEINADKVNGRTASEFAPKVLYGSGDPPETLLEGQIYLKI